jgi:hypothetical protein
MNLLLEFWQPCFHSRTDMWICDEQALGLHLCYQENGTFLCTLCAEGTNERVTLRVSLFTYSITEVTKRILMNSILGPVCCKLSRNEFLFVSFPYTKPAEIQIDLYADFLWNDLDYTHTHTHTHRHTRVYICTTYSDNNLTVYLSMALQPLWTLAAFSVS